jgi:hypothetical protein
VAKINVATRTNGYSFGAAAKNDLFSEGGLRISGRLVPSPSNADVIQTSATAGNTGVFEGLGWCPVSLNNISGSAQSSSNNLFGGSGGVTLSAMLPAITAWFRRWRLRKLVFHYEAGCPTSTTGTVQFSYDPDQAAVYNQVAANTAQNKIATARSVRTAVWQSADLVCIDERKSSPGDTLLFNSFGTLAVTFANADFYTLTAGAIVGLTDANNTGTSTYYGRYSVSFILDLYGMTNYYVDGAPAWRTDAKLVEKAMGEMIDEYKARHAESGGKKDDSSDSRVTQLRMQEWEEVKEPREEKGLPSAIKAPRNSKLA